MARHNRVEHRHNQKRYHCRNQKAADDHNTHWNPHFRTFGPTQRHWQHTQNGGGGGHKHGAQTRLARKGDGLVKLVAAVAHKVDVIDKHNTVLHHNTHKHYNAQSANQIECCVGYPQGDNHARNGERNGHHNDERLFERLELRRHYNEYQHYNQRQQHSHIGEGLLLFLVVAAHFHHNALRNGDVGDFRLHVFGKFAKRCLVGDNAHCNNTLAVAAVNLRWSPVFLDGGQLFQFDLRTRGRRNSQILKVGYRVAVFLFQADNNVVLVAVLFQEAHGHTVHAVADVCGNGGRCESVQRKFLFIDGDIQFGAVFLAAHFHVAGALNAVGNCLADLLGQKVRLVEIVAVNLNVDGLSAHSAARRRTEGLVDFGVVLHFVTQNFRNLEDGAVALIHFGAAHNH